MKNFVARGGWDIDCKDLCEEKYWQIQCNKNEVVKVTRAYGPSELMLWWREYNKHVNDLLDKLMFEDCGVTAYSTSCTMEANSVIENGSGN